MSDATKILPPTVRPPKPKATLFLKRAENGGWIVESMFPSKAFAYADFDSMYRDLPTIAGEND